MTAVNDFNRSLIEEFRANDGKGGAPTNPAWYHNLRANPIVTVELSGDRFEARAVVVEGDARERVWTEQKSRMPGFADYEQKTTRTIPVIALDRVA